MALKQHPFIISQFNQSEVWTQYGSVGSLSRGSVDDFFPNIIKILGIIQFHGVTGLIPPIPFFFFFLTSFSQGLFSASRGQSHSWLIPPPGKPAIVTQALKFLWPHFLFQSLLCLFLYQISLTFLPSSSAFKCSSYYVGPDQVTQVNHSILKLSD